MIKKSHGSLLLTLAALAQPMVCLAQSETVEEVVVFGKDFVPPVNSSGTKSDTPPIETPASLSVISRDLLDSWGASKLTEALRYTPGVNAEPFGVEPRFTSVNMRGFTAAAAGIFRDGLALINPGWAVSYNLEPYGAERVEVPRGPASVLYGQGSPGGLINFVSKLPKDQAFGEVGLEFGNNDRKQAQFDVGSSFDDAGTWSGRLTGLIRESDTQIDYVPDDRQFLAGSLRWRLSDDTSFTFLGTYQQDKTKPSQSLPALGMLEPNPNGRIPVSRFSGEPGLDDYDRSEFSVGYQFEHRFNDSVRFFQNTRYNDVKLTEIAVYSMGISQNPADADRIVFRRAAFSYGTLEGLTIDNQLHVALGSDAVKHKVLAGVDYQDVSAWHRQHHNATLTPIDIFAPVYGVANITRPAPWGDDDIELDQLGVYLQDEIKIQEKLIFNLGARYDRATSSTYSRLSQSKTQDQTDDELSLRGGVVYVFDSGFAPYASYAESFLPSSGVDAAGNPFDPETGRQYEVGVKYQPKSFNGLFTLALFDLERTNFVDRDDDFNLFQTGKASSRGVELEAFTAMDNGLSYIASYSYLDTEQKENMLPELIGKQFPQIPKHKAALWLDYNFKSIGLDALGVGFGARYQSSTFSDDLNTVESPSYTLYDAAVHYEWNNMRVALNIQNLADKEYASSCFTRFSVLCTVGETRSIRGSFRYRW
ncbi:TonB-dependent siderophore receptor [Peristeroidobacter soli]|uniref:TonB-dependent siderophore receptor n=1 Tax=Peristeroidobacter soli TaxID=2497877 RepID=UPI00101B60DC|nr:TonB-dependent siderophore receptor [Peristeroidobacter soli]